MKVGSYLLAAQQGDFGAHWETWALAAHQVVEEGGRFHYS